jgi:hypothetical protein
MTLFWIPFSKPDLHISEDVSGFYGFISICDSLLENKNAIFDQEKKLNSIDLMEKRYHCCKHCAVAFTAYLYTGVLEIAIRHDFFISSLSLRAPNFHPPSK